MATRRYPRRSKVHSVPDIPQGTPNKKKNKKVNATKNDDEFAKELEGVPENDEKPTELFLENDVDGSNFYDFNSPSKKNSLVEKAKVLSSNTPVSTKSEKKEKLIKVKELKVDLSIHNLSITPDKKNGKNDNEHLENKENKNLKNGAEPEKKEEVTEGRQLRNTRARMARDYNFKTDEYFARQSEKSKTSNNTLSRLKNRQLDEKKLQQLLATNSHIPVAHEKEIKLFKEQAEQRYSEWFQIMEEGFTVLLYGLGSKRELINNFHKKIIPDEPTLIINGFFPSLTIKEILDNIIVDLLGLQTVSNQSECFDIIEKKMNAHPDDAIYLLIHNLDGGMLRSNKAQDILSRLANIPNIHILASVDHINAPLIWDNVKRAKYNFYWMEATTFQPYEAETSYESSLLVQKSGALALMSLQNVFASLTANAKQIYILLSKYQLKHSNSSYGGMAFKDLYHACRESFLVSSDQALRAQLTEFLDHKLVKTKRNYDGVEQLLIPLDNVLLKQFIDQRAEAS